MVFVELLRNYDLVKKIKVVFVFGFVVYLGYMKSFFKFLVDYVLEFEVCSLNLI